MSEVLKAPASIETLENALIAWHDLWWRTPQGGGGPAIAKDGPWHLGQFEAGDLAGYCSLTLITNEAGRELVVTKLDTPAPKTSLNAAEVSARDQIDGWLEMISDAEERQLVCLVTQQAWRGHRRDWGYVAQRMCLGRSVSGLRLYYGRVMAELVCRLNGVPKRFAKQLRAKNAELLHPSMPQGC